MKSRFCVTRSRVLSPTTRSDHMSNAAYQVQRMNSRWSVVKYASCKSTRARRTRNTPSSRWMSSSDSDSTPIERWWAFTEPLRQDQTQGSHESQRARRFRCRIASPCDANSEIHAVTSSCRLLAAALVPTNCARLSILDSTNSYLRHARSPLRSHVCGRRRLDQPQSQPWSIHRRETHAPTFRKQQRRQ